MSIACKRPAAATICSALLLICLQIGFAQDAMQGWRSYAYTTAITLASVEVSASDTTFVFRNSSDKTISALVVTFYDMAGSTERSKDWNASEGGGLQPGQTWRLEMGSAQCERYKERGVTLTAVEFEDGSSEGVNDAIEAIRYGRAGRFLEGERVSRILKEKIEGRGTAPGVNALMERIGRRPRSFEAAIKSLEGVEMPGLSAENLMATPPGALQLSLLEGIGAVRDGVRREIEAIRGLPDGPETAGMATKQGALAQLREQYARRADNARAFLKRRQGAKVQ